MPELAELKIMSDYINQNVIKKEFLVKIKLEEPSGIMKSGKIIVRTKTF